jgi:hypothetical protein
MATATKAQRPLAVNETLVMKIYEAGNSLEYLINRAEDDDLDERHQLAIDQCEEIAHLAQELKLNLVAEMEPEEFEGRQVKAVRQ